MRGPVAARPGRPPQTADAELVALAVCQAAIGISSDRQFLGLVGRVLAGWFPQLPDQSQDNRRLPGLVELIAAGQQRLARWLDAGGARLADGTLIGVANYTGSAARSEFASFARYGWCRSQNQYAWAVRLVLLTDLRGLPLGYTLVPRQRNGVRATRRTARQRARLPDRRQRPVATRLPRPARRLQPDAADASETADARKPRARASPGRDQARDRKRLLEPQRPDPARATPGKDPSRTPTPKSATPPPPHPRNPAQHPPRTPRTRPPRLQQPLNHIKPLAPSIVS
jgi:hypothetical protein